MPWHMSIAREEVREFGPVPEPRDVTLPVSTCASEVVPRGSLLESWRPIGPCLNRDSSPPHFLSQAKANAGRLILPDKQNSGIFECCLNSD